MQERRQDVKTFLAREDVREQLLGMGVSLSDVDQRVESLTDREILQMHQQIDEMPAGGVLGAILTLLLIFLILDITGVTDIFPDV